MEPGHRSQLPEAEIRKFLSGLKIEHAGVALGTDLQVLLTRGIKKVENLSEAVAAGVSEEKKLNPAALPWSTKDDAAIEAFTSSFTYHEISRGLARNRMENPPSEEAEDIFYGYREVLGQLVESYVKNDSDLIVCKDEAETFEIK
ncbi:hypothetical protein WJX74_006591 [Apatococcus lobatus]|uniref:Uncharacterized protein n=1 Tax=Apatococcus lobatus TaxID=904363 RepID=A0AAW1QZD4_9CHLO